MRYKLFACVIIPVLGFITYQQLHDHSDHQEVVQDLDGHVQKCKEIQPRCACKHEFDNSMVTESLPCDDVQQQQNVYVEPKEQEKSHTLVSPAQVALQSALLSKKHKNDVAQVVDTAPEKKIIEEQDMHEACIALPDPDTLVQRLKKAGFPGLAKNKRFIEEISSKTFSSLELYEILSSELDKFKDVWVAHQRRGKLCNVIFQDYPDYVAYLKQREKIDDNPRLYWKAAKLYAKKLQPQITH